MVANHVNHPTHFVLIMCLTNCHETCEFDIDSNLAHGDKVIFMQTKLNHSKSCPFKVHLTMTFWLWSHNAIKKTPYDKKKHSAEAIRTYLNWFAFTVQIEAYNWTYEWAFLSERVTTDLDIPMKSIHTNRFGPNTNANKSSFNACE